MTIKKNKRVKVMAVASKGGHWIQLNRLKPVFDKHQTYYVSTFTAKDKKDKYYFKTVDANRNKKILLLLQFSQMLFLIIKIRPDVVVSTGASLGFFALQISKLLRIKTIWLDSMANGDEMSLSGKKVKIFSDVWLTQWENVADNEGASFKGRVI